MGKPALAYRDKTVLPLLGSVIPARTVLLDTNVFLNALTGRGPEILRTLLANLPQAFVSSVTIAELSWTRGRLDPDHSNTAKVVSLVDGALARIDPGKILTPTADQWRLAGERAGAVVRAVAGEVRTFKAPADRHEMLHDALSAIVASEAALCVITQDRDFDLFMQMDTALNVLFYD